MDGARRQVLIALAVFAAAAVLSSPAAAQGKKKSKKRKVTSGSGKGKKAGSKGGSAGRVSYRSCAEARAAGVAPIRRGEPGYGRHLDRDNDGIACE